MNYLLKTNAGERSPGFVVFVVWSAFLEVGVEGVGGGGAGGRGF